MHKTYLSSLYGWTNLRQVPQAIPTNALLENTEPTCERYFSVLGYPMLFQTNDEALLEMAVESFGRYPPIEDNHQVPIVVRLFAHDVIGADETFRVGHHPRVIYRTQGHIFYTSAGDATTVVLDLQRGFATGFINRPLLVDPVFVRYTFIELIAYSLLVTFGHSLPLHAACVLKGGKSAILMGDSTCGKSTLTMACVRQGYQIVSEDSVYIQGPLESPKLWGMPWKLHLLPDAKQFFPEISQERPRLQINGEWKLVIDMESYYPGSTSPTAPLGPIIFLCRGGDSGDSLLKILSPKELSEKFTITWSYMVGWTDELEQYKELLLRLPAFQLTTNGNPDQSVALVDEILSIERSISDESQPAFD